MDNVGALNVFVRAAEARSFTVAGRQLGVSSSAVGKSIARLEERLGVRLFHRSTRSITLTPEGTTFLESCRRIFLEIEQAERELAQTRQAPSGKLRVSLPMVGMLLMPTISRFIAAYPEIEMDLDFTDSMVNVIDDGFDVVVRSGEIGDSRLMARSLGAFSLQVFASPAYLARAGVPTSATDLLRHACLRHRFPNTGKLEAWPLIPDTDGSTPEPPVTVAASTLDPLIHLAEQGQGIVCVPDFAVRRQVEAGSLVRLLADRVEHQGVFRAVWPSGRHLSPKVRVFVDFLVAHLFAKPGA